LYHIGATAEREELMLAFKMPIIGTVSRIEPGKIVVQRGEVTEIYNPRYYRILPEGGVSK
jgi:hypothetical protein